MATKKKSPKERLFIAVWDETGLEAIIDITAKEKEFLPKQQLQMWGVLKDEPVKQSETFEGWLNHAVNFMMLRARANSHRHYEIYSFTTVMSIKEDDMVQMFKEAPQAAADLIRARGKQLYSNRAHQNKIVIT